MSPASLKLKIMSHPGPCVTIRNVTRALPCSARPQASEVVEAFQNLEREHGGAVVNGPHKGKVFLKRMREDIENDAIGNDLFKKVITAELYEHHFYLRDEKLNESFFKKLLKLHPNERHLLDKFGMN